VHRLALKVKKSRANTFGSPPSLDDLPRTLLTASGLPVDEAHLQVPPPSCGFYIGLVSAL
jgi:hypothetical protein